MNKGKRKKTENIKEWRKEKRTMKIFFSKNCTKKEQHEQKKKQKQT